MTISLVLLCAQACLLTSPSSEAQSSAQTSTIRQYEKAKGYYYNLRTNPRKAKYRDKWLKGIQYFKKIIANDPTGDLAAQSLYMLGEMYLGLFKWSGSPLDLGSSVSYYEDVTSRFPKHPLADDALYKVGQIYLKEQKDAYKAIITFSQLVAQYPDGDMLDDAAQQLKDLKAAHPDINKGMSLQQTPQAVRSTAHKISLKPIKYWSNNDYTRVVIETSAPVEYKENLLEPNGNLPRRLYIDFKNCYISSDYPGTIPIQDGLLKRVRCAQFSPGVARVVLDTQSFSDYKIFNLNNPFRIVVDVRGEKIDKTNICDTKQIIAPPSLTQQPGLCVRRIILDPGHGGKDPGAIGPQHLKEKNVVLAVAKRVARKIKKIHDCDIIFTRDKDVFVPLEERTAIANKNDGDLFISIHANAAPDAKAHGIETYYLSFAKSKEALRVAARENDSTTGELSDLDNILRSLSQNNNQKESAKLAEYIQESMIGGLSKRYRRINNLGVKEAPFVVLIGAEMPAILAEISFISNPVEAARLRDNRYLDSIADQLVAGVTQYISYLNMAGLRLY